jgi:hypothetical protein
MVCKHSITIGTYDQDSSVTEKIFFDPNSRTYSISHNFLCINDVVCNGREVYSYMSFKHHKDKTWFLGHISDKFTKYIYEGNPIFQGMKNYGPNNCIGTRKTYLLNPTPQMKKMTEHAIQKFNKKMYKTHEPHV